MLGKNESVQVPSRFALCYKSDCRRAGECLRYQVAECVSGERFVVCVSIRYPSLPMKDAGNSRLVMCSNMHTA